MVTSVCAQFRSRAQFTSDGVAQLSLPQQHRLPFKTDILFHLQVMKACVKHALQFVPKMGLVSGLYGASWCEWALHTLLLTAVCCHQACSWCFYFYQWVCDLPSCNHQHTHSYTRPASTSTVLFHPPQQTGRSLSGLRSPPLLTPSLRFYFQFVVGPSS